MTCSVSERAPKTRQQKPDHSTTYELNLTCIAEPNAQLNPLPPFRASIHVPGSGSPIHAPKYPEQDGCCSSIFVDVCPSHCLGCAAVAAPLLERGGVAGNTNECTGEKNTIASTADSAAIVMACMLFSPTREQQAPRRNNNQTCNRV